MLLALGLLLVLRDARLRCASSPAPVDWLALAYGALVVVYGARPAALARRRRRPTAASCSASATTCCPVAAYFFGRGPRPDACATRAGSASTILASAAAVAAFGLIDIYAIPLSWWRSSGAPGLVHEPARLQLPGPLEPARELRLQHRQRASAAAARLGLPLAARDLVHARDGAPARDGLAPAASGRGSRSGSRRSRCSSPGSSGRTRAAPTSRSRSGSSSSRSLRPQWRVPARRRRGARGRRRPRVRQGLPAHRARRRASPPSELARARSRTRTSPAPGPPSARAASRTRAPRATWQSLRDGIKTVLRHPQGYGPGNAGSTAARTERRRSRPASRPTPSSASTPGLVGGAALRRLVARRARRLVRCTAWLGAAHGGDARARAPDRHHRRALGRLRALAARRLARVAPGL